jgi:hypothetical protein
MKLGTSLLRDAIISLNQLEAALRTQVLYGGRLGTNLVELGFVDLDTLSEHLAALYDIPGAAQSMFEQVSDEALSAFGAERARDHVAFPLGPAPDAPDRLAVALLNPADADTLAALERELGRPIAPYVAPELRILYYLEKRYGVSRKARFVRPGTRRDLPREVKERRRQQPPSGIEMPPAIRLQPKPGDKERAKRRTSKRMQAVKAPPELSSVGADGELLSYQEARDRIDEAEHRDVIGDTLVAFAHGRFEVAVIFLLRDANALGWRVHSSLERSSQAAVEALGLPLGGASVLQAAFDTGRPFRGGPQSVGRPIEKRLWTALGVPAPPREMLVVPIMVRRRVVNLIYTHGFRGGAIHDRAAGELIELASCASDAYLRLIQQAKRSARRRDDEP